MSSSHIFQCDTCWKTSQGNIPGKKFPLKIKWVFSCGGVLAISGICGEGGVSQAGPGSHDMSASRAQSGEGAFMTFHPTSLWSRAFKEQYVFVLALLPYLSIPPASSLICLLALYQLIIYLAVCFGQVFIFIFSWK